MAARCRKAEARAVAEAAAAAVAGEDNGDEWDDVAALMAAAEQLGVEDQQEAEAAEPEPEPEPEECAICLNDLPRPREDGAVQLTCSHTFHASAGRTSAWRRACSIRAPCAAGRWGSWWRRTQASECR